MRSLLALIGLALSASACAPRDRFPHWDELDSFDRAWYSKQLAAAREQALPIANNQQAVRLTWLRTFHNPIVVRTECSTQCDLHAVRLSGMGGYNPGRIAEHNDYVLSAEDSAELQRLLQVSLELEASEPREVFDVGSSEIIVQMDGAAWIIEISSGTQYRAWNTDGPRADIEHESLINLCLMLVDLSRFEIPDDEFY